MSEPTAPSTVRLESVIKRFNQVTAVNRVSLQIIGG